MKKTIFLVLLGLMCSVGMCWGDPTPALPSSVLDLTNIPVSDGAYNDGSSTVYVFSPYLIYSSTKPSWATANNTGSTDASVSSTIGVFPLSSVFTGFKGATVKKSDAKGPYAYRVTNCLEAYALVASGSNGKRTVTIEAFEVTAGAVAAEASKTSSTTSSSQTQISVTGLDASKEYYIKVSQSASTSDGNSTYLMVAFKAPKTDPTFSLSPTSISPEETSQIKVGSKSNLDGITLKNIVYGTEGIVSVSASTGVVTPIATGTTTITFESDATGKYNAVTSMTPLSITVKVKTATTTAFSDPTTSVGIDENVTNVAVVSDGPVSAVPTYSSDDEDIATVDENTGEVTGKNTGSTTIRATYAGNEDYSGSSASYTITVSRVAVENKTWTAADLLAAVGGSATNINNSQYFGNLEVKGTESKAVKIDTGGEKTISGIGKVSGRTRLGQAGSADGNYLHFKIKPNTKITFWGIRASDSAMENGLALSIGSFGANEKVYSFAAGDVESFSYYYSGTENTDVYAYSKNASGASMMAIKVETVTTVSIAPSHDKITYVTTEKLDFTDAIGLNAYRVSAAAGGLVTIDEVGEVPASTPLLLIGTADNTYNIPVIASAGAIGTNMLRAGDGSTLFDGTTYDYLLYSDGLFYQIGSGTIAANKAYLHCDTDPTVAGAPGLRIIEEENTATNIEAVEANEKVVKFIQNGQLFIKRNGVVYDAMGRVIR